MSHDAHRPRFPPALLLVLAALLFAVMAVIAKRAAARLPGPEVAFVRFCVGLIVCALIAVRRPMAARNRVGLFLRGLYGGAAVLCYFLTIEHLPVGVATLLNYTAPAFTAIYAAAFLGEPVRGSTIGALSLTSVGVGLVMKGEASLSLSGSVGVGFWQAVGVLSAILSGAAVATIREVRKTDGSWEIFAAFCVGGAVLTGVPALLAWMTPTAFEWVALVAVGITSVVAQILMTYALRFVRAAVAGVIAQLTPVAALGMGALLFGERIVAWAAVGAALTLAGASWGAYLATTSARVAAIEEP